MESVQWFSLVAAFFAFVAAAVSAWAALRLYQLEKRRDSEYARMRERAGAARVSAWTAERRTPGGKEYGLMIVNHDEAPVFRLRIESSDANGNAQQPLTLHVLPPGEYFAGPGEKYRWQLPENVSTDHVQPITKREQWRVTELSFSDARV